MDLRRLATQLLDYIFPRFCPGCRDRLSYMERYLCPRCAMSLERYTPATDRAYERLYGSPLFGELYSSFVYRRGGTVQRLIYAFKYYNQRELAAFIVHRSLLEGRLPIGRYDAIIPVPISTSKLRLRGYNQSLLLSRELFRVLGVEVWDQLVRRRPHSSSQTKLHKLERSENARKSFFLQAKGHDALKGKTILLVDDILTTGATLISICDLLEGAGVAKVDVYVAAVAM